MTMADAVSEPLFQQCAIEGKGVGVIATADIPKYAIILTEKPLLVHPRISTSTNFVAENKRLQRKLRDLPAEKQRIYLSLHRARREAALSKLPFLDIFVTNSFGLGEDGTDSGLFELCSRFNHSCKPNAEFAWNEVSKMEEVRAIRDIAKGEEILLSYLGSDSLRDDHTTRQKILKKGYGFDCKCEVCSLPKDELEQSDHRRVLLAQMDRDVGDGVLVIDNPARALGMCRRSLEFLQLEGMDPEIGRVLDDAFQVCVVNGDLARASAFAKMCAHQKELNGCTTDESKEFHILSKNPKRHQSYGITTKWKTPSNQSREPGSEGFEEWLWSRAEEV